MDVFFYEVNTCDMDTHMSETFHVSFNKKQKTKTKQTNKKTTKTNKHLISTEYRLQINSPGLSNF